MGYGNIIENKIQIQKKNYLDDYYKLKIYYINLYISNFDILVLLKYKFLIIRIKTNNNVKN